MIIKQIPALLKHFYIQIHNFLPHCQPIILEYVEITSFHAYLYLVFIQAGDIALTRSF